MNVDHLLDRLRSGRGYRDQIVAVKEIPARQARFAEPANPLQPALGAALARLGIDRLYTHQAAALDAVSARRDVVVVTGTASGKTLCYNLPVLDAMLQDPQARALYLFPTKALAQDQLGALQRLIGADPRLAHLKASTYDGDTPQSRRKVARAGANIILTNPDMLHNTILPQHGRWLREGFLRNLRYVVIDELHSYRGIFGSHVAGVIRRLRRICRPESDPIFIGCSATIANPGELAEKLIHKPVQVIDDDGAPRGRKHFVLWNPPFVGRDRLERRSANVEAQHLMGQLIAENVQTITFARSRVAAELIYKYLREDLDHRKPELARKVRPYRGGYLPQERRDIERQLFSGELLGVCSTNALELGIDVGSLDAAIIVGFPGTICSTWQQAGRAGRRSDDALTVLIAYNEPIDQYLMRHPDYFFGQAPEHAAVDPANERIFADQLRCAAAELPITPADESYFGPGVTGRCQSLMERQTGQESWYRFDSGDTYRFQLTSGALPHHQIDLRMVGHDTYAIIDAPNGQEPATIGNVDSISALELVYPHAIYLHNGENYFVRDLDIDGKTARVERSDVDYYTQVMLSSQARILETRQQEPFNGGTKFFGALDVAWQSVGFKKIRYHTLENIGQEALDLPALNIPTTGLWAVPPERAMNQVAGAGYQPVEGLVGVRNLLLVTLPMLAMCDRRDISGLIDSSNLGARALFVYDRYHGGLGYAEKGYQHFGELLGVCLELIAECPCPAGCPSCVGLSNVRPPIQHDPDLAGGFAIPNKQATLLLLKEWLTNN
ncbi:MAG: DEAD/DEAH box helicase [Phycisphaerae bacterium]